MAMIHWRMRSEAAAKVIAERSGMSVWRSAPGAAKHDASAATGGECEPGVGEPELLRESGCGIRRVGLEENGLHLPARFAARRAHRIPRVP
jgi:hypothetical protein